MTVKKRARINAESPAARAEHAAELARVEAWATASGTARHPQTSGGPADSTGLPPSWSQPSPRPVKAAPKPSKARKKASR